MKQASSKALLVACSSKMLVNFQWTTQRYIPEDRTLHNHCCENLKSYFWNRVFQTNLKKCFYPSMFLSGCNIEQEGHLLWCFKWSRFNWLYQTLQVTVQKKLFSQTKSIQVFCGKQLI
jgi:hypothetical protein